MTLALHGKSARRRASLALIGVTAACGALMAGLAMVGSGAEAASVAPVFPPYTAPANHGNPTCADLDGQFGGGQTWLDTAKINKQPEVGDQDPGGVVTITSVTPGDPFKFSWTSTIGIDAVLVKQGSSTHAFYVYAPTAASAESFGDTDLSPMPGQSNSGGVSHVSFCYDTTDPETPTPETPSTTPETPSTTPETPSTTPETPTVTTTPETPTVTTTPETPTVTATPETPTATPETPTATPETPTATPETPTNTPENTPTNTPESTVAPAQPTAIDTVAGALSTPAAPSAGAGLASNGESNAMLFAILGLVAASAGFASLALATSGRRED